MSRRRSVENLSVSDERLLKGFDDPVLEEEPQIIPPELATAATLSEEEKNMRELSMLKERAEKMLDRISDIETEIDRRCENLSVTVVEGEDSDNDLLKAMWRVFREKTTKVTYSHYKQALTLRDQLAKEDEQKLRKL